MGAEVDTGEEVVGQPVGQACQCVRSGWHNGEEVRCFCQGDVADAPLGQGEEIGMDRLLSHAGKGERCDERARTPGEDGFHVGAGLGELARQRHRLERRDTPTDA